MRTSATSPLRMWGYGLVLTALAFVQEPGRIVGDTKFDLVVDPGGFLARAAQLWDPNAAFGQMQNQAYGYFWPMGPFFVVGDLLGLPPWVVQRLWWALLLCLAFVGAVKVAKSLGLGMPWTQVVAGFAFALSPHALTLLGPTSVEAWPSALAPWVLLPLVRASREGSVRRGAALSALAVAMCGGVNAVAVLAVLPLGAVWLATRENGRRRLQLAAWWVLFTALATVWWVVPLLLLGRYSVPFLDYIENAPITTLPTSLPDVLGGTSDWVAYISSEDWVAGHLLGTTPILIVNAAVVAGIGLAGIARRDNEHRHFLLLGVLVGVLLVTFGYTGPLHGWWADGRQGLLDGDLSPFRNLHKFDVVLRLCLVLGLAHFLAVVHVAARTAAQKLPHRMLVLAVVASVVGVAVPAYAGELAPGGSFDRVPAYWTSAARYLAARDGQGVALEIPATAFGDYRWGSPHDDVLQPLASSPWAVRNVIPLAQPGNVRFLDAVTRAVELGRPSSTLAEYLAGNGVGHLVVRNDIDPQRGGSPDGVVLHQVLDRSPGLTKVAEFGPVLGEKAVSHTDRGVRIVSNRGRQAAYAAVEIYSVAGARGQVTAWEADSVPVVAGDPSAGLRMAGDVLSGPTVLAGDRRPGLGLGPTVLTDGLRRREMSFTAVRNNESATMTLNEPWSLGSVVPNHRIYADQARFETYAAWLGIDDVKASTAQSRADSVPPIRQDQLPAAAMDGHPATQWRSASRSGAVGEWWRVEFEEPLDVREVTVRGGTPVGLPVTRIRIRTASGAIEVDNPDRGESATFRLPEGRTSFLQIRAVTLKGGGQGGQFSIAEVSVPGVEAERFLVAPDVFRAAPQHIFLSGDPGRPACAVVGRTNVCDDFWRTHDEERSTLRREVPAPQAAAYTSEMTASLRPRLVTAEEVAATLPVRVSTSKPLSRDVAASGLAAVDGNPYTAWVAALRAKDPYLELRWDEPVALDTVDFDVLQSTPGAQPRRVLLKSGRQKRFVELDEGRGTFDELVTDKLRIQIVSVERAYSFEGAQAFQLPAAVGEIYFPGAEVPTVDPEQEIDQGCGSGPTLSVNGVEQETRIEATLREIMSGDPLPADWCGDGRATLRSGTNTVRAFPSPVARADELHLQKLDVPESSGPRQVPAGVKEWQPSDRALTLGSRAEPSLLVVGENFNPGWEARLAGKRLESQRVDGWKQGWVVPAGAGGLVTLEFTPNRFFRWTLPAGGAALLLVLMAALLPSGRHRRPAPAGTSSGTGWLVAGASLVAGGLLAGWVGAAAMLAAVVLGRTARASSWGGLVAGGGVIAAGAAHAYARSDGFHIHSLAAQSLALAALVVAVAAVGAKGPRFFRRRNGRSSA